MKNEKVKEPTRSVEDQQFLDIAAIMCYAGWMSTSGAFTSTSKSYAQQAFDHAELLLTERNNRK